MPDVANIDWTGHTHAPASDIAPVVIAWPRVSDGCYVPDGTANLYRRGIVVLTLAFDHISGMTSWWDPNMLGRFGLPDTLAGS